MAVGLQWSQHDVNQPQWHKQQRRYQFASPRPAQLAASYRRPPPVQQCEHAQHSQDSEEGDGEGQISWVDLERFALGTPGDGGDGPRHADAQEDVHCIGAGDVANGGVSILVLDGSNLAGKCVWKKERKTLF